MREKAFLVGTHRYSFQAGKPLEIIGVEFVTPPSSPARVCYRVRADDGQEDFCAISETHHYEIVSESDVKAGRIPAVTN